MKNIFFLILAFLFVIGCDDPFVIDDSYPELTTFEGTFVRSSPNGKYMSSEVSITFENGLYTGSSTEDRYPAICEGSFEVRDWNIVFSDSCVWTADFDWTLILNGEWEIIPDNSKLILSKQMGDNRPLRIRKEVVITNSYASRKRF